MIEYENGVHIISNDEYHYSSAISRSALMDFKRTPYHYWYKHLSGEASHVEPTTAMVFGELIHTLSLERSQLNHRFAVMPKIDRRTNAGKLAYSEFLSVAKDKLVIDEETYAKALKMAKKLESNTLFDSITQDADIEHSIYFTHATTGIQCKVRPDIWTGSVVGDLKTTNDASYRGFQSSAYKYGYYLQAGMINQALYSLGIEMEKFIFIAIEKDEPYAVGLYALDDDAVFWGSQQFDELMEKVARCIESKNWPDYGLQNLCVPGYAKYENLPEIDE